MFSAWKLINIEWMNDTWSTWLPLTSSRPRTNATNLPVVGKIFFCLWQKFVPSYPLPQWALQTLRQGENRMNHASVNENGPLHYDIWNIAFKSRFACVWQWVWVTADSGSNHQKSNKTSFLRNIHQPFEDLQTWRWTLLLTNQSNINKKELNWLI